MKYWKCGTQISIHNEWGPAHQAFVIFFKILNEI